MRRFPGLRLPSRVLALGLGLGLLLAACGGDDPFVEGADEGGNGGDGGGEIVIASVGFTEAQIMAEIYSQLLADAGYETSLQSADTREIYVPAMQRGEVDLAPEYAATMVEYLNREANGPDAPPLASNDPEATVEALRELAEPLGLGVYEAAEAADQNAYAVTQAFAQENDLTTLSDLGEAGVPVRIAGPEVCPTVAFCQPALEGTYGIEVTGLDPLGFNTPQVKQAVERGDAQLGVVATTDGTLDDYGLVILDDDQQAQLADNLVPVYNADGPAADEAVGEALNGLAPLLTTDDLIQLNRAVDVERQQPAAAAAEWLAEAGLVDG